MWGKYNLSEIQGHLVRDLVVLAHKMKTEMHGVTGGQLSSSEIQLNQPEAKYVLHCLHKGKEHSSCVVRSIYKELYYCGLFAVQCLEM
jgi:hypothetical protein